MNEFQRWQLGVAAGLGFLAAERSATQVTRAKYGMPVWQIYALGAGTSLATMTVMDQYYVTKSESKHSAFREYHSTVFSLPEPVSFLPNPLGIGKALFETGMMIGEAVNPFEQTLNFSQVGTALLTRFIAGPDVA